MRIPARTPRWLALIIVGLALAAPAFAREGNLTLKDGRTFTGEVVADDEKGVTLRISGIPVVFGRADVDTLTLTQTIQEQYTERRAKIGDDDLERRYGLTYWLYEHKAYDLAQREIADMLKRFPNDESVHRLKNSIDQKLKLIDEQAKAAKPGAPAAGASGAATKPAVAKPRPTGPVTGTKFPLFSDEQVNAIRLYDIEPDNKPRVEVPSDVIDMLFRDYSAVDAVPRGQKERVDFRRAPGYEQLRVIFAAKARELYPMVRVLDDPVPLVEYRQIQQRYVLNYCGAAQCHGGDSAHKFVLARDDRSAERMLYTNYYILYQYQDALGYMIDVDQPDKSYLLQYGLPADQAATPHPAVRGYTSFFRSANDTVFQGTRNWIAGLTRPRQRYPIEYELPTGAKPAATPALAPASAPKPAAPKPMVVAPTTAPSR